MCLVIGICLSFHSRKPTPLLETYTLPNCIWEGEPSEISPIRGTISLLVAQSGCGERPVASDGLAGVGAGRRRLLVGVDDGHADDRAAGRDQHHLVAVAHDTCAGEHALRLRELDRLDAHPAATLARVV